MNRALAEFLFPFLFAVFFLSIAPLAFTQDENTGEAVHRIDRPAVVNALAEVSQGDEYIYEDSSLDDPAWLIFLRDWLRSMSERWSDSPIAAGMGSMVFLMSMLVFTSLVVIGIIVLSHTTIFHPNRNLLLKSPESPDDFFFADNWIDAGLNRAEELISSGKNREAISILFNAVLVGLDRTGWIRFHKSVPSRTYLRQLRRSAEIYPLFRDLLWRFEVAYYGKDNPENSDWEYVRGKYSSLAKTAIEIKPPSYMGKG
ncbi:MAG: hypothetical protein ABIC40_00440 [bacterium]